MFEWKIETLVHMTIVSMDAGMYNELDNILKDITEIDTFEKAYEILDKLFTSKAMECFFKKVAEFDVSKKLDELKSIAALYCCYFGMDYMCRTVTPQKILWGQSFLGKFYECDADSARLIYDDMKKQVKKLNEIKKFEDPKFINPYILKKNPRGIDYNKTHIYFGHIISYLNKTCYIENKILKNSLYLYELIPSITSIALKSVGFLPNGGITNKSVVLISSNILDRIDEHLNREVKFSQTNISTFAKNKINYDTNIKVAELINLAVVDDLFRLDRVDFALKEYIQYIIKESKNGQISLEDEYAIASACSLYLYVPLPIMRMYKDDMLHLNKNLIRKNKHDVWRFATHILSFSSVIFPYIIGVLCFLLYYDNGEMKSADKFRNIINDLETHLDTNYAILANEFAVASSRMWNEDGEKSYVKKTRHNSGTKLFPKKYYKTHWKEDLLLEFDAVTHTMMSQQQNILKTRNIIEENFMRKPGTEEQKQIKYKNYNEVSYRYEKNKGSNVFKSEEYAVKLAGVFMDNLLP